MTIKSLENRIQRLEDVREIQNLLGKRMYLSSAGLHKKVNELFAQKIPSVTSEAAGEGVYDGIQGLQKSLQVTKMKDGDRVGFLSVNTLTTPVVEVANDGKTAKGIWLAPGCTSRKDRKSGKLHAYWVWAKVGVDFIKEDGTWKIWHYQVYMIFQTRYEESWIEPNKFPRPALSEDLKPDRPTTYHHIYGPTSKTEYVPAPPEPYETWDGKSMTTSVR
jgi:hypothetical protein